MKTNITILFMCFALCSSFGQSRNSFDIIVGVDRTFRTINANEDSDLSVLQLSASDKEEAKFNWRFGANYNKSLTDNSYLKFGVRLSSIGYQVEETSDLRFGSQHDGEGGFDPDLNGDFSELSFNIDYLFIELPVSVGLIKSINKFSFYGEAGLSPNIYLTSRTKQVRGDESDSNFQNNPNTRALHLSGVLNAGVAYQVNNSFSIFGQPSFRYHLTKLAKDGIINEHLYSYGIEFGVRTLLR